MKPELDIMLGVGRPIGLPSSYMRDLAGRLGVRRSAEMAAICESALQTLPKPRVSRSQTRILSGCAVPWNSLSAWIDAPEGRFREIFKPGAFAATLGRGNVDLVDSHERGATVLASTAEGTLSIFEGCTGLIFSSIHVPELRARLIHNEIQAGLIQGVSILFGNPLCTWETINGQRVRMVNRAQLIHIALAKTPAYRDSHVSVKCL